MLHALGLRRRDRLRAVFGPGSIDQAYGAVEWVEIGELARAAGIYARWGVGGAVAGKAIAGEIVI